MVLFLVAIFYTHETLFYMERTPTKSITRLPTLQHSASDPALNKSTKENHSNITRRVKRKCEILSENNSMDELKDLIIKSNKKQDAKFEALSSSLNSVLAQNAEIHKTVEFISQKYDDLLLKLDSLQCENNRYKTQIITLENKLELIERNSKASVVEIKNIPKPQTEKKDTLQSLVKNIGSVLELSIQDSDIRDVFRLKTKEGTNGPIVVEFTTVSKKENLLKACKTFHKENKDHPLSTQTINHPGPSMPIYVTESLTKRAKHLFYLARLFKKDHHYHGCWTSYGKIYLRKQDGSPAIQISNEDDLAKLK